MLRRACSAALDLSCSPVIVVLGANNNLINPEIIDLPVAVTLNPEWKEGLASSIRHGVRALCDSARQTRAVLLMLADQPLVTSKELCRLIERLGERDTPIVASEYQSGAEIVRGVPAVFSFELFPELVQLRGTSGAKSLIRKYEALASYVPIPQAAIDIDTDLDLETCQRAVASV